MGWDMFISSAEHDQRAKSIPKCQNILSNQTKTLGKVQLVVVETQQKLVTGYGTLLNSY